MSVWYFAFNSLLLRYFVFSIFAFSISCFRRFIRRYLTIFHMLAFDVMLIWCFTIWYFATSIVHNFDRLRLCISFWYPAFDVFRLDILCSDILHSDVLTWTPEATAVHLWPLSRPLSPLSSVVCRPGEVDSPPVLNKPTTSPVATTPGRHWRHHLSRVTWRRLPPRLPPVICSGAEDDGLFHPSPPPPLMQSNAQSNFQLDFSSSCPYPIPAPGRLFTLNVIGMQPLHL